MLTTEFQFDPSTGALSSITIINFARFGALSRIPLLGSAVFGNRAIASLPPTFGSYVERTPPPVPVREQSAVALESEEMFTLSELRDGVMGHVRCRDVAGRFT